MAVYYSPKFRHNLQMKLAKKNLSAFFAEFTQYGLPIKINMLKYSTEFIKERSLYQWLNV